MFSSIIIAIAAALNIAGAQLIEHSTDRAVIHFVNDGITATVIEQNESNAEEVADMMAECEQDLQCAARQDGNTFAFISSK